MLRVIVSSIYTIFGNEYLRRPNNEDTERLLQMGALHKFLDLMCLMKFYRDDAVIMKNIIYACIILHNMIVEGEHDTCQDNIDYNSVGNNKLTFKVSLGAHPSIISTYLQRRAKVHDKQKSCQLQANLVEHI
ncbi:hypothetical protein JHK84_047914 [Glycine max]|uniref:Uncharacterized protein n=1 Tax=Glycine max TaxID=3847 RepID=A0A0R0FQZ3_SOYBN|nr:hypothetical protein JHK86_047892 [Glycine max]KAG4943855.1 hypothetical protein JHK85_048501 [Glycine max]KAG5102945.1 hypothetical protein JHK84_047914 [Glycine max]